ncbi:MAG: hypothetical protein RIE08_18300 [Acidimicrobiales bacterium]
MRNFSNEPNFVTGLYNSEDIAVVPDTKWMIASGMASVNRPAGHLYLVDLHSKTGTEVFPDKVTYDPDVATYGTVDRPDPSVFDSHGLALRPGDDGLHTLYVVNHGGRESIEVFLVDAMGEGQPHLAWVGAIIQDDGVWGNAVAPLLDGGIVATNFLDLRDPEAFDKVCRGEVSGNLKEWHAGVGWTDVPDSALASPNGVEVSPDNAWYYVCSWATREFVRISRGVEPVQRTTIPVEMMVDNVKWSSDDTLLTVGSLVTPDEVFARLQVDDSCNFPFSAIEIDPDTLEVRELVRLDHEIFGTAATALYVGDDLWISSGRNDRIAWFEPER